MNNEQRKAQPNGIEKLKNKLSKVSVMKAAYEEAIDDLIGRCTDVTHGRHENLEIVIRDGYVKLGELKTTYAEFGEEE